jgi:hypothetical protein
MSVAITSHSTVRSRALGDAVRLALERQDFTGKRIAEMLGWSESKMSRILTGHLPPTEVELSAILALCRIIGENRDYLLELCRNGATLHWSGDPSLLVTQQQNASHITEFQASLVPVLLQTQGYGRSVGARMVNIEYGDVDAWLALRARGHSIFERIDPRPPNCSFFIHEQVLHLPVGGHEVMLEQVRHLLRMQARRYVNLRIIPSTIGAYPSTTGSFSYLEFADFAPLVYIEDELEGHFLERDDQTAKYQRVIAALAAVALDNTASAELLQRKATTYCRADTEAE